MGQLAGHVNSRTRSSFGLVVAGIFSILACEPSYATGYNATGTVIKLVSYDLNWFGANTDFFNLSGVTSLGTCGLSGGYVVFRLHDDVRGQRMFAGLSAAMLSGNTVIAYVDDQYKDSLGFCYAIGISFGQAAY
jgi:hypothetical protein